MSWDRPFAQPVPLPEGPPAQTLRDAAAYIRKLPQPERDCQEWRLAVQMRTSKGHLIPSAKVQARIEVKAI